MKASIIPRQYLMVSFFVCSTAALRLLVSLSILVSSSFVLSRSDWSSSRMRPFSRFRSNLWLAVSFSISYLQAQSSRVRADVIQHCNNWSVVFLLPVQLQRPPDLSPDLIVIVCEPLRVPCKAGMVQLLAL